MDNESIILKKLQAFSETSMDMGPKALTIVHYLLIPDVLEIHTQVWIFF